MSPYSMALAGRTLNSLYDGLLREELRTIDSVKAVVLAAELAVDFHLALLFQDAFDLRLAERAQHGAHAQARARAAEVRRQRLEHADAGSFHLFPVQALDERVDRLFEQFFAAQRLAELADAFPRIEVLLLHVLVQRLTCLTHLCGLAIGAA